MFFEFFAFRCPECRSDFELAIEFIQKREQFACPSCGEVLPGSLLKQMRAIVAAIGSNWVDHDVLKRWTAHVISSPQYPVEPEELLQAMRDERRRYWERQRNREARGG